MNLVFLYNGSKIDIRGKELNKKKEKP